MKLGCKRRVVVILADGLLLFLGLYGTVFSFVTAFGLSADTGALGRTCLFSALGALLVFSLPKFRYRLPLCALWAAGLGWTIWTRFSDLTLGALFCGQRVGALFAQRLGGLPAPDFSAQIAALPPVGERAAATLLFTLFVLSLALLLGLAVVRRRSFWLAFGCTFPFLLVPLSITVTPARGPLFLLLLFWSGGVLTRLTAKQDPYGSAKHTLITLPLTAALLFCLSLALPQKDYKQTDWADRIRLEVLDKLTLAGREFIGSSGSLGLAGGSTDVNLGLAGPLRYTGKEVLRVESEVGGHLYLRGFSAAVYTGSDWNQLPDEAYQKLKSGWTVNLLSPSSSLSNPLTSDLGSVFYPGIGDYQPINFPALADEAGFPDKPARKVTIENTGAPSAYVYTPYQLLTTPERMKGAEFVNDAYLARGTGIWRYVLYARDGANPERGALLSGSAAEAEDSYRAFVLEHYTQVPEDLRMDLSQSMIAAEVGIDFLVADGEFFNYFIPSGSRVTAAKQVADYLATVAVYDPETPFTPAGEDFVAHFLNTGRGYCMHFASAATLMLRSMGVPARYVSGYTADVTANVMSGVPDQNAHAWVEVYCNGYGWQPVEVTPGFSGSFPWTGSGSTAPTPSPTSPLPTLPTADPKPSHSAAPKPSGGSLGGGRAATDLRYLLIPAALLLLAGALYLRRELAQRRRARLFGDKDANRAVIALYGYALRLLRYHPGEEFDPAAEALGQKAKFSQHTLTEDERAQVRTYVTGLAVRTDRQRNRFQRLVFRYILGLY